MKPDAQPLPTPRANWRGEPERFGLGDRLRAALSLAALILIWSLILIPSAIWCLWAVLFNREALKSDKAL